MTHSRFINLSPFSSSVIGESVALCYLRKRHFSLSRPEEGRAGGSTPTGCESFIPPTLPLKWKSNTRHKLKTVVQETTQGTQATVKAQLFQQEFVRCVIFDFGFGHTRPQREFVNKPEVHSRSPSQRRTTATNRITHTRATRTRGREERRKGEGGGTPPMNNVK